MIEEPKRRRSMLWYILGGLVAVVAVLLLYASTKPDTVIIRRKATIAAPAEKIYPHIANFHAWGDWSPWEKIDPNLKRTFTGPDSGKGAAYAWEGNKNVGQGRMEILEAQSPNRIDIKLDFLKPFEAHNKTVFTLSPQGGGTEVDWAMTAAQPFMFKVMCLFMNMDKMVGGQFEQGLASLKSITEKP